MTLFKVFDLPVFWPILLVYFIVLFLITMKRQIQDMLKRGSVHFVNIFAFFPYLLFAHLVVTSVVRTFLTPLTHVVKVLLKANGARLCIDLRFVKHTATELYANQPARKPELI